MLTFPIIQVVPLMNSTVKKIGEKRITVGNGDKKTYFNPNRYFDRSYFEFSMQKLNTVKEQ